MATYPRNGPSLQQTRIYNSPISRKIVTCRSTGTKPGLPKFNAGLKETYQRGRQDIDWGVIWESRIECLLWTEKAVAAYSLVGQAKDGKMVNTQLEGLRPTQARTRGFSSIADDTIRWRLEASLEI